MLELKGPGYKFCDGVTRRDVMKIGFLGATGLTLADLLDIEAAQAAAGKPVRKHRSVILIWNHGGPPHLDMLDMKPGAPSEYRGPYKPIKTNIPGIEITERMPRTAKVMDKIAIHRGLNTQTSEHFAASHFMLTGHLDRRVIALGAQFPSVGSVAAKVLGAESGDVPAYVVQNDGGFGFHGAAYLGPAYHPIRTGTESYGNEGKPLPVANTKDFKPLPTLSNKRLDRRRQMMQQMDRQRRDLDAQPEVAGMSKSAEKAFDMLLSGRAEQAFDISREPQKIRDLYGPDWGANALRARRLVEAGVRFVTCNTGYWDLHGNLKRGLEHHLPRHDRMISALVSDLADRGMLDDVLVITGGEFGRTPRMNTTYGAPGRNHWHRAQSFMVAGGGYRGGQVIGKTDALGENVIEDEISPYDWVKIIYHSLGIDTDRKFVDFSGRPQYLVPSGKGEVPPQLL